MKNRITLATIVLAIVCFSLTAAAQRIIDFGDLPRTGAPLPIPSGYAGMNWHNVNYITERLSTGVVNVAVPAFNSWGQTMSSENPAQPFQLLGLSVVGQFNTTLTLYAYNHGTFVGSQAIPLAPVLPPIRIPAEWGTITQLTFVCMDSQHRPTMYNLWSLVLE
jgi:hypothetical protein